MFNKLKENIKEKLKDWLDINNTQTQIVGILKSAELDRNTFTANIKRINEKLDK